MFFLNPNSALPLPIELYALLPVVLIVGIIGVLLSARNEADPRRLRPLARYLGAVGLLTLFVTVWAAFGAVGSLTDLVVDHQERFRATEDDAGYGFSGTDFPVLFPLFGFAYDDTNDSNYDYALAAGLTALTTGAVFVAHARWRRRLEAAAGRDPVVDLTGAAYRCGVAAVAGLTLAVSVTSMGYAIFELIAPGVTGYGYPASMIREEAIAELLAFLVLAAISAVLVRWAWGELRPRLDVVMRPPRRRATSAKKASRARVTATKRAARTRTR